ncbi:hypothetical protein PBCV1_a372L [Paramecium bursaria Chlorella virus 1]|uniref:Uncharacterized protein n=1 Tax=Paramecium bursaria Chlorella virus 1 TaxID=10506 RepID=Q98424_PBCV1|nr:hypothetical protein PBCV1_a372L [Paramecium bursaria Chlorella virus 1]AAC96740.1 hypothetical protein [Paramecium bursaria Chlorella virus 1]
MLHVIHRRQPRYDFTFILFCLLVLYDWMNKIKMMIFIHNETNRLLFKSVILPMVSFCIYRYKLYIRGMCRHNIDNE